MDKPWKVITAFIGVFIAGAVFGAFFALGIGWRVLERHVPAPAAPTLTTAPMPSPTSPKRAAPGQPWPVPQAMQAAQIIRRLADRLDLTPAQRERIMPFIQRAVEDFRRQQANYFREDAFILQRLQNDISRELTPEQRGRLAEMEERQREIMHRRQVEWQALQKSWESGGANRPAGNVTAAPGPNGAPPAAKTTTPAVPAPAGAPAAKPKGE